MTLAEEKALLARFAKAAGAGEMLNIVAEMPNWRGSVEEFKQLLVDGAD
jgi:hypothetical protein